MLSWFVATCLYKSMRHTYIFIYKISLDYSLPVILLICFRSCIQPFFAPYSARYCDDDENGVRHMVLCRVIMGNMEPVNRGSKQFHPSCEDFDSGVDDFQNPSHYIIWNMNMNTHIYPEYVVSFKVSSNAKGNTCVRFFNAHCIFLYFLVTCSVYFYIFYLLCSLFIWVYLENLDCKMLIINQLSNFTFKVECESSKIAIVEHTSLIG